MELDKLGAEMHETGMQGTFGVDPQTGDFRIDLGRGNDVTFSVHDPDLTAAFRKILPRGSVDKIYCGWSIEDVLAFEPTMSAEDATFVLGLMAGDGDATLGFCWATLEAAIHKFKALKPQA